MIKVENLKNILLDEIKEFNEIGRKFVSGEVSRGDFRNASCGMGVYAHRDGKNFMIRLRIAGGAISNDELEEIYELALKYKLKEVHLTTRQDIQLHGLTIDEICEVMKAALKNNIYSRGGGGSYPGNIVASAFSGIEIDEAFDVIPYVKALNEYIMKKIYNYKLPKKLQISFSNGGEDSANCTVTDMGFLAVTKASKKYFKLFLGGGLGRNPSKGIEFDELVEPKDILYHIEAMTKLFEAEGDYENKGKARIRYIVKRMGESDFIKSYKYYLEKEKLNGNLNIEINLKECSKKGMLTDVKDKRLFKQKQNGLYSVYVHPLCGQLSLENFKIVLYKLNHIEGAEIRLSKTEGFYIINLNGEEAEKMLQLTKNISGTTRLEQSISCVGMPVCQIGILNSQSTLRETIELFREKGMNKDILPRVYISGCPNSCGTHEIGEIGFAGKKKKVDGELKNIFQLHLNGCTDTNNTNLSEYFADILEERVPEFLYELAVLVEEDGLEFHQWLNENKEKVEKLIQSFSV